MTTQDPITFLLGIIAGFMALMQYQTKQVFSLLKGEIRGLRNDIKELIKKIDR